MNFNLLLLSVIRLGLTRVPQSLISRLCFAITWSLLLVERAAAHCIDEVETEVLDSSVPEAH